MDETTRERIMKKKIESLKRRGHLPADYKESKLPFVAKVLVSSNSGAPVLQ